MTCLRNSLSWRGATALPMLALLVSPLLFCSPVASQPIATRLERLTAAELHNRLQKALSRPLPATWDGTRTWYTFAVDRGPGAVSISIHRDTRELIVNGPAEKVAGWRRVVAALDAAPATAQVTELVPTSESSRQEVRRALGLLQAGFQNQAGAQRNQQPARLDEDATADAQPAAAEQLSLLGPVQIEYVEGLDVIVVRGSEQDVARVMEIIERIEAESRTTRPEIRVQPLQHVDSVALAALLERVYSEVLRPRTGDVHITPLGQPNALLLIGRRENVSLAVELITKLDQPAPPTTRYEVFPLKNAAVLDVKPLVDQLLAGGDEEPDEEAAPTLRPRGFTVADVRTNSLIVTASPRDLQEIRALIERVDRAESEARDQLRVFPLRNTVATDLATVLQEAIQVPAAGPPDQQDPEAPRRSTALELLAIDPESGASIRSGVLAGVRITADQRTNSLVVTAPADTMPLIAALIEQLDSAPNVEAQVKVFTVKNGDATSLSNTLSTLFAVQTEQQAAGAYGASESALVRLQLSVDRRTNSIIAVGTARDLEVVEAILYRLDSGDIRERITEVYRLRNASADSVAESIQTWLQSRREAQQSVDVGLSPYEQLEREVIVVPEIVSNSLIVSATPRYIDEIRGVINDLDQRPPMVMIQVLIAEVRLNDTDEFGVELGLQDSLLFDRSLLQDFQTVTRNTITQSPGGAVTQVNEEIIVNAPLAPGFNFNNSPQGPLGNNGSTQGLINAGKVAAQGLSNFALNRVNNDLGFSGFVLSASSSAVNVLLRALQENRRLEVLSRPQIMAMDGRQGSVELGEEVPIIRGVSLTDFAQNNQVEYRPVGLILRVLPHINQDGLVVMEIEAEKSAVGNLDEGIPVSIVNGQPINAPRIALTRAYTTVSALSGQTIVLSGLLSKETFDLHRRVPIIADIPLLGDLFRYDSVREERRELLIILTPRVIRNKFEAEMLKQVESSRMSWVLSDVVNLHGAAGLRSRCDEWYADEAESVYPTYVPHEGEVVPYYEQPLPADGPALEWTAPPTGQALPPAAPGAIHSASVASPRRLPSTN